MSFVNIFDSRPSFQKMFLFFLFSCDICPGFSSATTGTAEPLLTRCLARSETSWQRRGQVIEAALRKRSQDKQRCFEGKKEKKILITLSMKICQYPLTNSRVVFPQVDKKSASAHDSKASLLSPPDPGFAVYMALNICVWIGLWFAVTKQHGMEELNPHYMAFLVSVGPLVLAQVGSEVKQTWCHFD